MSDEITITIRKGDLEAVTTAFWVCSNIATGGEMFIDGRKDYVAASSALGAMKRRIEEAAIGKADV